MALPNCSAKDKLGNSKKASATVWKNSASVFHSIILHSLFIKFVYLVANAVTFPFLSLIRYQHFYNYNTALTAFYFLLVIFLILTLDKLKPTPATLHKMNHKVPGSHIHG